MSAGTSCYQSRRCGAAELVAQFGDTYSKELGIELAAGKPTEIYKWFFAAVLFGARISEAIAIKTYREFERAGVLSPDKIVKAGWDRLVRILDSGGYARYDFKTATKLLEVNRALLAQYKGDLNALHSSSKDASDLEQRLKDLGKGIGDVTVNIFLRELRGIWRKAAPLPSDMVMEAAKALGFVPRKSEDRAHALEMLMAAWTAEGMRLKEFPEFEAALIRFAKASHRTRRVPRRPAE